MFIVYSYYFRGQCQGRFFPLRSTQFVCKSSYIFVLFTGIVDVEIADAFLRSCYIEVAHFICFCVHVLDYECYELRLRLCLSHDISVLGLLFPDPVYRGSLPESNISDPPCHQGAVIIIIVVVPALTK